MLLDFFMDYGKLMHLDTLDDETFVPAEEDDGSRWSVDDSSTFINDY
jgi:hypothetical protein